MEILNRKTEIKNQAFSKRSLTLTLMLFSFFVFSVMAQESTGFGIKGGLNYNANGNYFDAIEMASREPDRTIGYHVGVFGKFGNRFYFRPELVYTNVGSDYVEEEFKIQKLDAPLLFGVKVIGPLAIFGGPSLQYILNTEFEDIELDNVENDFTVGLNFGIGLNLGKVGLDLRYERSFSDNEVSFVNDNISDGDVSRIDTRPDQLILSLSVAF